MVDITRWKYGKRWVYSTTYDEVVTSTVQNGLPYPRAVWRARAS